MLDLEELDLEEMAELLGVSRITVARMADEGGCRPSLCAAGRAQKIRPDPAGLRGQVVADAAAGVQVDLEEYSAAYTRPDATETERRAALDPWLHTCNHHRGHTALKTCRPPAVPPLRAEQLGVSPRDCRLGPEHAQSMQILIDVVRSGDGRLAGTARPADSVGEGRRFAGVMELVACLEQLCTTASLHGMPSGSDRGPCPRSSPTPADSQQLSTEGNHHG